MTNNLAQRAADELRREAYNCNGVDLCNPEKTVSRLLARIDELEAQTTRRSEPMPEPVPEWLLTAARQEMDGPDPTQIIIARLIWGRGDAEPVDPLLPEARKLLALEAPNTSFAKRCIEGEHDGSTELAIILQAIKRGMELQKEIG